MTKSKAIILIILSSFLFFIAGLGIGHYREHKRACFWVDRIDTEELLQLKNRNEKLIWILDQHLRELDDYLALREGQ